MTVTCPGCGWSAEVPDDKIPAGGRQATCPKCKTKFTVIPAELPSGKPTGGCEITLENINSDTEGKAVKKSIEAQNLKQTSTVSEHYYNRNALFGNIMLFFMAIIFGAVSTISSNNTITSIFQILAYITQIIFALSVGSFFWGQKKKNTNLQLTALETIGAILFFIILLNARFGYDATRTIIIFITFCVSVCLKRIIIAKYSKNILLAVSSGTTFFVIMLIIVNLLIPLPKLPDKIASQATTTTTPNPELTTITQQPQITQPQKPQEVTAEQLAYENLPKNIATQVIANAKSNKNHPLYKSGKARRKLKPGETRAESEHTADDIIKKQISSYKYLAKYMHLAGKINELSELLSELEIKYPYDFISQKYYIDSKLPDNDEIDNNSKGTLELVYVYVTNREVVGYIINNSSDIARSVYVKSKYYDENGIQVGDGIALTSNLSPNDIWKFKMNITNRDAYRYKIVSIARYN